MLLEGGKHLMLHAEIFEHRLDHDVGPRESRPIDRAGHQRGFLQELVLGHTPALDPSLENAPGRLDPDPDPVGGRREHEVARGGRRD